MPVVRWFDAAIVELERLLQQVHLHPLGRGDARRNEVLTAVAQLRDFPELYPVRFVKRGLAYRLLPVGQFCVIYTYELTNSDAPEGIVWIRAVRHARVQAPLWRVREIAPKYQGYLHISTDYHACKLTGCDASTRSAVARLTNRLSIDVVRPRTDNTTPVPV